MGGKKLQRKADWWPSSWPVLHLDPHRQTTGRTAPGRNPLRHRKLPPHQGPGARLPRRHPARTRQYIHPTPRRTYTYRLGRQPSVIFNRAAGTDLTVHHSQAPLNRCGCSHAYESSRFFSTGLNEKRVEFESESFLLHSISSREPRRLGLSNETLRCAQIRLIFGDGR